MFLMVTRPLVSTPAIKGFASETNLLITRLGRDDPAEGVALGGFGVLEGAGVPRSTLGGTLGSVSDGSTVATADGAAGGAVDADVVGATDASGVIVVQPAAEKAKTAASATVRRPSMGRTAPSICDSGGAMYHAPLTDFSPNQKARADFSTRALLDCCE